MRPCLSERGLSARSLGLLLASALIGACTTNPLNIDREALARTVSERERAFARTMADRDHAAFVTFVSEEAVFMSGPQPLRGRDAISAAWQRFYTASEAPFSWEPDAVEVLDSGTLALSTGTVRDARSRPIARFTSIWRLESPGVWRVVFDRGSDICDCAAADRPSQKKKTRSHRTAMERGPGEERSRNQWYAARALREALISARLSP